MSRLITTTAMKIKTWYWVHKWLAIITGIAILLWLLTGLVITAPGLISLHWPENHYQPQPPDFRTITMTPSDAVGRLADSLTTEPDVRSITLLSVHNLLVYQIMLVNGESHLIDAATGQLFKITPEIGAQIAQQAFPSGGSIVDTELLESHDTGYFHERIPAYRYIFDDRDHTYVYVSLETGTVIVNNRLSRQMEMFEAWHTFAILGVVWPDQQRLITMMLWISSFLTILAALSGYYLALPKRWRPYR